MNYPSFSVLMSVYIKEKPEYLRESIMSILDQTILPDEIILVKDGQLTNELESVLDEFKNSGLLKIVEIKENVGLGRALNKGLIECRNEIVARMDTDDIAKPERFEKQLKALNDNLEVSLIGTAVDEFIGSPKNIVVQKFVKTNHNSIKEQIKYRNPIIHPTVIFKKSKVIEAGNYQDWFLNEDYYLWVRMIEKGNICMNINETLVSMRINDETYMRRGGKDYYIAQKKLFDYMKTHKIINTFQYYYNNSIRFVVRILMPNLLRKYIYLIFLRKKVQLDNTETKE